MKKQLLMAAAMGTLLFSAASHAADAKKPMSLWLCSDFLQVTESYRPIAVSYAAALNHQGKPEDAVLNVEGIQKMTPLLVKQCNENPKIKMKDAMAVIGKNGW